MKPTKQLLESLARAGIKIPGPSKLKAPKPRYTRPEKGKMNKLESRYATYLEILKKTGEIHDYAFEPEKFRLANQGDACYFTPDFRVLLNDGTVEFRDTKGHMEEDALIKIKWFVQQHPYPLVVIRWVGGQWTEERFEP